MSFIHGLSYLQYISSGVAILIAGAVGFFTKTIVNTTRAVINQKENQSKAQAELDKTQAATDRAKADTELLKETKRRDEIDGLRSIIEELRVSRDEALEARRLMTNLVESLRAELADVRAEMARRDERCEERISMLEQNQEKRVEMLKRQHTEEIAELARQMTAMNKPMIRPEPVSETPSRIPGTPPTIDSGAIGAERQLKKDGSL